MAMRSAPPRISIRLPNFIPRRLPNRKPSKENPKDTAAMTMEGATMGVSSIAIPRPTAMASMLTARLRITSVMPCEGSLLTGLFSASNPERIMRTPTKASSPRATQ